MPSNDVLADMISRLRQADEEAFTFEGFSGEALVMARQYAELAFLTMDRCPPGLARRLAISNLKTARDRAITAAGGTP